ncbi:tRNA dihydrouridine synthase DusB [Desulfonema magnum]|uniref:tRNA-dihydrouridine synthase n=1 Tax=Desulfonema magnum TaxID=45655 RepID=A0A975BNU4_9BACT|nr:tRNA dihydrouridine synthase DusB [Desulfonema magnum]QTA88928.1 putative tRNA-dihydrouridine synthase [Desulfonema magnum]
MKIGSLSLKNITVLAPLAGITNLPFRLLVKEAGCALVCSEMISANGLVYKSHKTIRMLESAAEEKPLSVQIFGSDPSIMADAAAMVEASGADVLDINFGCSVKKVLKTGSGSALMKAPEKTEAILKAVRNSVKIPFTIKIRSGWDYSGTQALKIAEIAESCGVNAIAVHPRTATQGFGGSADWSVIAAIKKSVSMPVIGNGDIVAPEDAIRMQNQTGCDAVMIGRAGIGNPWIFSQVLSLIRGEPVIPVDIPLRYKTMIRYLEASVEYIGEEHACRIMRSRLGWFTKGLPHSSVFRESIKRISSEDEAKRLIKLYMDSLLEKKEY